MNKSDLRNNMARRIQNSHNSRSVDFMSVTEARRLAEAAMPAVDIYVNDVRGHLVDVIHARDTTERTRRRS